MSRPSRGGARLRRGLETIAALLILASLSACADALPSPGALTGALTPLEAKLDCRQLAGSINAEIARLKAMPALAHKQQSAAPPTMAAMYARMSGTPGAGVPAATDYAKSRSRLDLLAGQAVERHCHPPIDVAGQLAETDRIMAGAVWDVGTGAEARAMLDKLIVAVKADRAKAFDAIRRGESTYKDRDLGPLCAEAQGGRVVAAAFEGPPSLQGLRDPSGTPYGDAMLSTAREGHVVEVRYLWSRADRDEPPRPRVGLVTRIGDLVCTVGYFK